MSTRTVLELERSGQPQQALAECSRCLSVTDDPRLRADLLAVKARLLDWHGSRYDEAEAALREELALRVTLGDDSIWRARFQLALMLVFQQRAGEAQPLLRDVLASATDPGVLARAESLLGDLLVEREPVQARTLLLSALGRLTDNPDNYLRGHLELSLAWLAAVEGDLVQAEASCREGLRRAAQAASPGLVGTAQLRLAQILGRAGRHAEAREHALAAAQVGRDKGWQVLVDEAGRVAATLV
ncbi:MAG: hypothetical protein QM702_22355 [Rubrivivax sp.]